jgi:ATP-dependent DNA ligase
MNLPVSPPLAPMLSRLARELPDGLLYEPKWDGFRCLVFRDGEEVELKSRNDRPLGRYFPEVVEALQSFPERRFVLDGELLVSRSGRLDFASLLARLHPAKARVEALRRETPAFFAAFDILAFGNEDLCSAPFSRRRAVLEDILAEEPPGLLLTPLTAEIERAAGWLDLHGGIEGVMAKDPLLPYMAGKRAMVKVKRERTADCVVAGFRLFEDRPLPSSLLLGLYGSAETLHHVGVAASFAQSVRRELLETLRPLIVPLAGHPWEHGFLVEGSPIGRMKGAAARWVPEMGLDWLPVSATLVCEVSYEHLDGDRFRHPARFRRFRPDRDARSCTFEQFEVARPHVLFGSA